MALVSFSNSKVTQTYATPHTTNVYAILQIGGASAWRRPQALSADGVSNMFALLRAAKATGRTVSGSYEDSTGQLHSLFLN